MQDLLKKFTLIRATGKYEGCFYKAGANRAGRRMFGVQANRAPPAPMMNAQGE